MKNPMNWLKAIVGFTIGVAVLTATFATGGPFASLLAIPTSGALSGTFYAPIITAVITAVPLGILGLVGLALYNSNFGTRARSYVKVRRTRARSRRR